MGLGRSLVRIGSVIYFFPLVGYLVGLALDIFVWFSIVFKEMLEKVKIESGIGNFGRFYAFTGKGLTTRWLPGLATPNAQLCHYMANYVMYEFWLVYGTYYCPE